MANRTMKQNMEQWMESIESFADGNGYEIERRPGHWYSGMVVPKETANPIKELNDYLSEDGIEVHAIFIGYINDPSINSSTKTIFFKLMPNESIADDIEDPDEEENDEDSDENQDDDESESENDDDSDDIETQFINKLKDLTGGKLVVIQL